MVLVEAMGVLLFMRVGWCLMDRGMDIWVQTLEGKGRSS